MCRICVMTQTDTNAIFKPLIFDRMMLMASADNPPQRDGWGVSDGEHLFKANGAYRNYSPAKWMDTLQTEKPWLGHVRHASSGTALTDEAAHPYRFPHFIGIHNGAFTGTWTHFDVKGVEGVVNTDTWRAFHILNKLLDSGKLLDQCIDEWLSLFEDDSAFVVALLHNKRVHIVRGPKTRDLYFGTFGNGLVFHTDKLVLQAQAEILQWMSGETIEAIEEFPALHYAVALPGEKTFDVLRPLNYNPVAAKSTYYDTWTRTNSTAAQRQTGDKGKWIRVTKKTEPLSVDQQNKLELWGTVWQLLYPMREKLALHYMQKYGATLFPIDSYTELLFSDLTCAKDALNKKPLTDTQRKRILLWNELVTPEDEVVVYESFFGDGAPFWELENCEAILYEFRKKG